jgi:hypothetical protein
MIETGLNITSYSHNPRLAILLQQLLEVGFDLIVFSVKG